MQVVRKSNFVETHGYCRVKECPADLCLTLWADWMRGDCDKDLGYKSVRSYASNIDCYGTDREEQQQARDNQIAQAVDVMIDSLPLISKCSIYKTKGISTVWRFNNADLATVFNEATLQLEQKLRKNSCTRVLF